ncbi:DUF4178 domain-containing protein [Dethiothermospora halolimnae]|uniref:DUF4178 domain-containing protein n=1 Tax=Dethiothermospora halolimnae TaxID=3114390 RepID=UPI003CCB9494
MGIFDRLKKVVKANKNANVKPQDERNIFNLKVGDIVSIEDVDYEVKGVMKLNDSGWKWTEYKIKDARQTYWLSVEEDDEIEISLSHKVTAITTEPPKKYEYEGVTYYMQEGSEAVVEDVSGKINVSKGDRVDYYEYSDSDDEKLLSIEIWDGQVEMSKGRWIETFEIEIFPGS